MEYAESLVRKRFFHASEIAADDDKALKDLVKSLILVCPACKEAVFKCGSAFSQRQYFSHFAAKPNAHCELRVQTIIREALAPKIIHPRGQELDELLKSMENILREQAGQNADIIWHDTLEPMRARTFFRKLVHERRENIRSVARELANMDGMEEHVREIVYHITAANSFRLLMFSVCYGVIMSLLGDATDINEKVIDRVEQRAIAEGRATTNVRESFRASMDDELEIKKVLLFGSNRELKAEIGVRTQIKKAVISMVLGIVYTAVIFSSVVSTSEQP